MAEKVDPKTLKQPKDIVAQDRNWTIRVNNELESEQKWSNQWGFYAKGRYTVIKDFHLKRLKYKKNKRLMIGFINSSNKLIKSTQKFFRLPLPHMEKEIMSKFTKIINTIFTKTKT